jgi:TolB-like protein/DNA-binding winged helix-turn-helix (wHTH) protein/Tfp pilus assembly protein PilF
MALEARSRSILRFGVFEVDLRSGELRKQGVRIKLQEQPFQVLTVLLQRPGDVVTREELRSQNWPADTFVDFDNSLNTAINKLREALGDSADNPRFIETLPRRGYRFIASVDGRGTGLNASAARREAGPAPRFMRWLIALFSLAILAATLFFSNVFRVRDRVTGNLRPPRISSLAVLPLANLSGDPAQEYFSDGMTDALITDLARTGSVKVISRTSVMRYKKTDKSLPEIARELNVDGIIEGTVQRSGDHVRITAQLIYAPSDKHLWVSTYDRELRDVLTLQSDVSQGIARQIEIALGPQGGNPGATRAVAPAVYESYLKGRFELHDGSRAALEEALRHFQAAIDADPTFAPAYAGLAATYSDLGTVFRGEPPLETRPKAFAAAGKALELDPQLVEAHIELAGALADDWRWQEAEAEYKRAIELSPNNAEAHADYAEWLNCQGRTEEALMWARRAQELDPLALHGTDIGWILFSARRYDEAIRELRAVLAIEPDKRGALWFLGFALIGAEKFEEAIQVLERVSSATHRSSAVLGLLVHAYAGAGRRTEGLRILDELHRRRKTGYVPPAAFLNAYLGLGDKEEAFKWLGRAVEERSKMMQFLKIHPFLDPLRGDPRFAAFLRRANFQ